MAAPRQTLNHAYSMDRREAVPELIGPPDDFLIVCGLAGPSKDISHLTDDADYVYTMAGAMGAAVSMGLGLALARPEKRVLVVTGDGELLMNVGALATAAVMAPANLSIVCVDNGHYGETGYQQSHTGLGVDLEQMAIGAGFTLTRTIQERGDLQAGRALIRRDDAPVFINLQISTSEPPAYRREYDAAHCRVRFKRHLSQV